MVAYAGLAETYAYQITAESPLRLFMIREADLMELYAVILFMRIWPCAMEEVP